MLGTTLRQTWTIIRKDLRRELRTKEILTTTITFAILLMVIFTFAFYQDDETVGFVFPGILWVAIIFAGNLAIGRTFIQEKDGGCLRALALIPNTHVSLFLGKLVINLLFMTIFEIVLLPILALAFDVNIFTQLGPYVLVLAAGTVGFAALGTLLAAMLVHSHLREVLLPILLFPLLVPLLIVGVKATAMIFEGASFDTVWPWIQIILAMDIAYLTMGQFLFRYVLSAIE